MEVVLVTEDTEQLLVEVPASLKALIDDDERTNKEIVIAAVEQELGVSSGDSVAIIDRKIKRLEDRFEEEKAELERRRDRLEDIRDDLDRYREIREEQVSGREEYASALDDILAELEAGDLRRVFPSHGRLDVLRQEFDRPNEEIHLDLKERAADQERDLTVAHFKQQFHTKRVDEQTPIADHWGGDETDE